MIDPRNKWLKIVDRVKEIFKLQQWEYIAPAKLEWAYMKSPFIAQICIYGNSEKPSTVWIIVVNKWTVWETLVELGLLKDSKEDIEPHLNNKKLVEAVQKNLEEIAKQNKFNSLERPGGLILTTEEFSIQNWLLTPTLKLVRKKIETQYKEKINEAYNNMTIK